MIGKLTDKQLADRRLMLAGFEDAKIGDTLRRLFAAQNRTRLSIASEREIITESKLQFLLIRAGRNMELAEVSRFKCNCCTWEGEEIELGGECCRSGDVGCWCPECGANDEHIVDVNAIIGDN